MKSPASPSVITVTPAGASYTYMKAPSFRVVDVQPGEQRLFGHQHVQFFGDLLARPTGRNPIDSKRSCGVGLAPVARAGDDCSARPICSTLRLTGCLQGIHGKLLDLVRRL